MRNAGSGDVLDGMDGNLVPGGFGERGAEGKIQGREICARKSCVPYFGICFGMQMAVVEAARNLAGLCRARILQNLAKQIRPLLA